MSYRRTNEPSPLEVEPSTAGATAHRDLEEKGLRAVEMTVGINVCTACGCCVGKEDEDWQIHLNWHRLLRNLTTYEEAPK